MIIEGGEEWEDVDPNEDLPPDFDIEETEDLED